ncbi:MAG: hypothetical protein E7628_06200 [Ruminococcaceae bacterium]|nr:hypothetical protein [Oscillospiraceae bacterium]
MKLEKEVKQNIYKIAVGSLLCSIAVVLVFLAFGRLDYTVFIGTAVGYLYAVGNFFFMCVGITNALALGDENAAKMRMRSSYMARTAVMVAVIAASLLIDWINPIPVLISVFYPKIIITVIDMWNTFVLKKGKDETVNYEPVPDDEEEETDEFEKFVGRFSKGPVPGEEDKNMANNTTNNEENNAQ